jgi:hypothetical protein
MPIHKRSIQERNRWQGALEEQRLPPRVLAAIRNGQPADVTSRCKKLAAALMWTQGVELDGIEASLLQHMPDDNAAGPIRSVADRTRDVIGVIARIAEILDPAGDASAMASACDDLVIQLELGVPGTSLWLARKTKRALTRGDYLALTRAGLRDAETLHQADAATVERLLPNPIRRRAALDAVEALLAPVPSVEARPLPMPAPPDD